MPLGTEVGLGPGDLVLDGDPAAPKKGHSTYTFRPMSIVTNGWIKMPLGTEVDLCPGHIMLDGAQIPPGKGNASHAVFSAHVHCGQTVAHLSCC